MNKVPTFVANSEDDIHCVNAVFRMISKHLLDCDYSWDEIDVLTKAIPGKGTWTFVAETEFAKRGLNVKNIEPIDYEQLHKQGIKYLSSIVGKKTYDYIENKSNLESVLQYIPEFISLVTHETRRATVEEIIEYLKQGKLIAAEINSSILNNDYGFSLHFVLLYDFDGSNIILHDPGLPPVQERKVSVDDFNKCFNFEGANGEIALFWK